MSVAVLRCALRLVLSGKVQGNCTKKEQVAETYCGFVFVVVFFFFFCEAADAFQMDFFKVISLHPESKHERVMKFQNFGGCWGWEQGLGVILCAF